VSNRRAAIVMAQVLFFWRDVSIASIKYRESLVVKVFTRWKDKVERRKQHRVRQGKAQSAIAIAATSAAAKRKAAKIPQRRSTFSSTIQQLKAGVVRPEKLPALNVSRKFYQTSDDALYARHTPVKVNPNPNLNPNPNPMREPEPEP